MLCLLSRQFPPFVADFLDSGRHLKRKFREETVTDLLMADLIMLGGRRIAVEYPNEMVTGADMEWNFVNEDKGTFFRVLLQAKKAYSDSDNWKGQSYTQLFHKSGNSGKLQASVLCDAARAAPPSTFPMYIFYNPGQTCRLARRAACDKVEGVNLASGYEIEHLVTSAATTYQQRVNRSVATVSNLLFPLTAIFCPSTLREVGPFAYAGSQYSMPAMISFGGGLPSLGIPQLPTPETIRDRILGMIQFSSRPIDDSYSPTKPTVEVASEIPDDVLQLLEQRSALAESAVRIGPRWRIVFMSSEPNKTE
jgi:hypothetical protein